MVIAAIMEQIRREQQEIEQAKVKPKKRLR
jgi:hypothetical protein